MSHLKELIQGNIPLHKTFWIYYCLTELFFSILILLKNFYFPDLSLITLLILVFLRFACVIVLIISLWNSSGKFTGRRIWFYLIRFYIAYVVLWNVYSIIINFFNAFTS